jgi:hypothetical protein
MCQPPVTTRIETSLPLAQAQAVVVDGPSSETVDVAAQPSGSPARCGDAASADAVRNWPIARDAAPYDVTISATAHRRITSR